MINLWVVLVRRERGKFCKTKRENGLNEVGIDDFGDGIYLLLQFENRNDVKIICNVF